MIIFRDLDFEMEQVKDLPFFDLKLPVIINKGKVNERIDMKIVGHAMPFKTCINEIIIKRLSLSDKEYISFEEFKNDYLQEIDKLTSSEFVFTIPDKKRKTVEEKGDSDDEDN